LLPISLLPWALGFAGAIYGAAAAICGALLVALAWQLRRAGEADRRAAHRLFAFSIFYLFVLFAALLASNSSNRWSSLLLARAALAHVGSAPADAVARPLPTAPGSAELIADEV
jgi:protoheme IX farnesyltransferase